MSTAEYPEEMSEIAQTETPDQVKAFQKLHEAADKIHTAELPEIKRFKSLMDRLISIESDIKLIKEHLNIVPIIKGALQGRPEQKL